MTVFEPYSASAVSEITNTKNGKYSTISIELSKYYKILDEFIHRKQSSEKTIEMYEKNIRAHFYQKLCKSEKKILTASR